MQIHISLAIFVVGNAHECIMGRMHRNATHVNALKCVYMHHVQNAYIHTVMHMNASRAPNA